VGNRREEHNMNTSDKYLEVAKEYAVRIRARTSKVREIIVFGSVARGEATEKSDLDIALIVEKRGRETEDAELEAAVEAMNRHDVLIGTIAYSPAEWRKARRFPLGCRILEEGVRV
jgi:predicted nucleotidyltransferase